jgi:hypothetical protein
MCGPEVYTNVKDNFSQGAFKRSCLAIVIITELAGLMLSTGYATEQAPQSNPPVTPATTANEPVTSIEKDNPCPQLIFTDPE